jgi:hypothetical protein
MICEEDKMKSKEKKLVHIQNIITELFVVDDRILRRCKHFIINS